MSDTYTKDLGAVTAYADAKAHGYTGTREEFGQLLANAGINLQEAKDAKEAAGNSAKAAAASASSAKDSATKAAFDAATNVDSTFLSLYTPDTMETFTGNPITCYPGKGSPLAVTVQGKTGQAGGGTAAPENIRALSGLGESGTLTLTAEGGETRTVEIPLTGPLYTGDSVALDDEGKVVETHRAVKLTVDGSENWIQWTNPRTAADITVPGTIATIDDILCSHYHPLAGDLNPNPEPLTVHINTTAEPGKTRIIIYYSSFGTLAKFKEYLKAQADAGTPVTFVYKVKAATPTVTEQTVTPLRALPAEDGSCTVSGEGEMTVSYRTPVSSKIREFEKRIAALEAKA